jgi:hypothetical protein
LLLVGYWFATYSNPGQFYSHRIWLTCLFCWTVILSASGRRLALAETSDIRWIDNIIEAIVDPVFAKAKNTTRTDVVRILFVLVIVILDLLIQFDLAAPMLLCALAVYILLFIWRTCYRNGINHKHCTYITLSSAIPMSLILCYALSRFPINWQELQHLFFYYFYCVIAVAFLWKEIKSIRIRYAGQTRYSAWGLRICILTALYYMSVLAFAYGVYPNIPAAKGGGNFEDTANVRLYLRSDAQSAVPTNICENITTIRSNLVIRTIQFKIIHASDSTVYLADPNDPRSGGGVMMWSKWHTPRVFAIQKDMIITIEHLPYTLTNQVPPTNHAVLQHPQAPTHGIRANPNVSKPIAPTQPSH